ncbi:MAG TPA: hypothetical protein VGQ65_21695 [Thermoanaerobaculia bacterium]|nr:hypothetical protein [Thermoanaerobaculia bacterium]
MSSCRIRWSIIAVAALFSVAAEGQMACAPTPETYRNLEFGEARFAVEEDCRHTFTQDEQFFLAGIARRLRSTCKRPRDREGRALMEQFTKAAELTLDLQKRRDRLYKDMPSHPDRASAFAAGTSMMDDLGCNGPEAALLARGLVLYLKRTSGSSRFVAGCVETYTQRYAEKECRCVAVAMRPVFPDVDQRFFDRELIKESIHRSPRVALTLIVSCGVQEY